MASILEGECLRCYWCYNRNLSIFITHLLWWQSRIESSMLRAGSRKPRQSWGVCVCARTRVCVLVRCICCVFVFEWMLVLIKHQQLLGPGGGKTSQPLNQDNAFCVTGAGVGCPASPPSPRISSPSLPSHLLTPCQSLSSHAAYGSKNKWWLPKCMVKARQVGRRQLFTSLPSSGGSC